MLSSGGETDERVPYVELAQVEPCDALLARRRQQISLLAIAKFLLSPGCGEILCGHVLMFSDCIPLYTIRKSGDG